MGSSWGRSETHARSCWSLSQSPMNFFRYQHHIIETHRNAGLVLDHFLTFSGSWIWLHLLDIQARVSPHHRLRWLQMRQRQQVSQRGGLGGASPCLRSSVVVGWSQHPWGAPSCAQGVFFYTSGHCSAGAWCIHSSRNIIHPLSGGDPICRRMSQIVGHQKSG